MRELILFLVKGEFFVTITCKFGVTREGLEFVNPYS